MPLDATHAHGLILERAVSNGHWFFRDSDVRIRACCTEAEHCQAGDLFVVLDDPHLASQDLIELAIERGAVALMCERPLPNTIPQFVVDDCRVALGQVAHALAGAPTRDLPTIGLAGTYGKSVTGELLRSILRAAGQTAAHFNPDHLGGQGAMALARELAKSRSLGADHAIIECSTTALTRKHLSGTQLDAIALTNVHRSPGESARRHQANTLRILEHRKPDGFVVLNADDRVCQQLLDELDAPALTIGLQQPADVTAQLLEREASEQTFLMNAGSESMVLRTRMIGDGHIYNCLSAAAISLALGIDPVHVARGIEQVESLEGRLQRIECGQPFGLFIEQLVRRDSLGYALQTLRSVSRGRLHCLVGVNASIPGIERARIGRTLEQIADRSVLTSDRVGQAMALRTGHDVLDGFDRPAQAHVMPDRAKAICWLLSQAEPGDVVLLAGGTPAKGPDDVVLADHDVAQFWLRNAGNPKCCPWQPA